MGQNPKRKWVKNPKQVGPKIARGEHNPDLDPNLSLSICICFLFAYLFLFASQRVRPIP